MITSDRAFDAKHIPGSINVYTEAAGLELLDPDGEIVVYCSYKDRMASQMAYEILRTHGYTNVRRYAGGIADWEDAGCLIAGQRGNLVNVVESA